ncbi:MULTISPECIES: magnesium-translocating P-type ATPase [unclassified Herbaspirillum]|uniref:magnesium-translocating P-type ATPase n=1 Tax=unclassified Herbaspirillum TaxID=2624150 RepID=UPI001153350B|nr:MULTISPECIES: magnesium-translocating P-type ATPase [unclassified Herbaspirillum]MBB5391149.1 Mg2+-importing ATPase [Herbaspirillum sp. SJZ102]TQK13160.1 Mg2+-importing ATPase [Herbaspirillum sp. SJZ130]TQK15164.1 Mg2+-importing ATPase [Herbaspirillum sp. SJZ106]TWC67512.1 Mg2+-importing ATPase [Herbaspirillum sp. SJZ099]
MNLNLLKETFAGFIRARGMDRHFRRLGMDMFRSAPVTKEIPQTLAQQLNEAARCDASELLQRLKSRHDGLTEAEADAIRAEVGPNEVEHEKPLSWPVHLWHCYKNPFNLLLTLLAAVSFYTEDMKAAIVIGTMVVISTLLRFVQEARSNTAADKLKAMVSNTATVMRHDLAEELAAEAQRYFDIKLHPKGAKRIELPIKKLVPGDIVLLSAGDMIPADLRLLSAKDLFVSQAAMTGESLPVEKFVTPTQTDAGSPLELENLCFMGTNVVSGSATGVVLTTGKRTYFGALAERVTATDRTPTAFQAGVNKVSWLLIRFMLVMTPVVFFLNGFTKGDWVEAFLFGLSVAVGLTPEMLPMIVTSTLAKGAVALSRKKVIVKRLDAIQNFGAMDVLCTDKTGTLTQDKIFLERHTDIRGEPDDEVLQYAYLNSYYQTGLKNLLDVAVLEHAELQREMSIASAYRKVDEIPFDFQRRRMSVVVSEREDHHELICKGAVEEIVSVCTRARHDGRIVPLTPELLAEIRETTAGLNAEGLRVVGVAAKDLPPTKETYSQADESDLVLVGYIAFLDPPKESTAPALAALREHGVAVKILTGDNELVTAKICREVGLEVDGMLLGSSVEKMSDEELSVAVEKVTVFAKLSPTHKERIVRVLHDKGHVVGFMGDGINDAPALRAADIGISVDTAVDIAKEAADLILLEKSLMVLEEGVLEGRKTFANMLKYIKMTASSNFGNVFSVLIASAFLPFLPMLPLHLLVQNLLYDVSQISIPFDNVDKEFLEKPQRWDAADIGRFMVFFGPISSIFDVTTFALMWYIFGANSPDHQTLFQSGWFIEGLLSQTLIVHMIRTRRIPFLQSRASWPLLGMTLVIMAIGIFIPMSMLAHYFKLEALPLSYFPWLAAILLAYAVLIQLMKNWYAKRYGWQ